MGGREVPPNLVLSGSTTRQSPKNQQLSGEAEQGREQTTTATTRNANWEQQQLPAGTESIPGRQQSSAETDVATHLSAPGP